LKYLATTASTNVPSEDAFDGRNFIDVISGGVGIANFFRRPTNPSLRQK
jgi:hypothetical protein